jgi:hypothetical protein
MLECQMEYERNQLSGECKRDGWNITMKMKLNCSLLEWKAV